MAGNIEAISKVLIQKLGEPTYHHEIPEQMQEHYLYLINRWVIGTKIIEVRIVDNATSYQTIVQIYKPRVEEKI